MIKRHLQMVVTFLLACGLSACGGGGGSLPSTAGSYKTAAVPISNTSAIRSTSPLSAPGSAAVAIDAGSTSAVGNWLADTYYSFSGWGEVASYTNPINTSLVPNAPSQSLYQTQRWAPTLTYTIPNLKPNAAYNVRLHFAECYFTSRGQRLFDIKINGSTVLTNFDIFQAAGGANVAIAKNFVSSADSSGKITIQMTAAVNNAVISGLEISDLATTPTPAPNSGLFIASGSTVTVGEWTADTDYTMTGWGSTSKYSNRINMSLVSNPPPASLYQTQRWAPAITYTIPTLTPHAQYTVRLHFVECYFNARGQRVFNVKINGNQVLTNFDIIAATGGANMAIAKSFNSTADSYGRIVIELAATVNNAVITGVEVTSGSSGSIGSPTPTPTAIPTTAPTPTPITGDGSQWVFSQLFSSSSPMRTAISTLKAQGATTVDHQFMDSFWTQGFPTRPVFTNIPIYMSKQTDPLVTVSCLFYGGRCNASGLKIHENPSDYIQWINSITNEEDHHLLLIDQNSSQGPVELDCWQAGPRSSTSTLVGNNLQCGWAGLYHLGTNGMHGIYPGQTDPGMEGVHFGPAVGSFMVTGTEMLSGHIDHALALNVSCLNNPSVYPADTQNGTDTSCDGGTNPPHYGNAIHLTWTAAQIASSPYSAPCKAILTAMATYGAYMSDTGDAGTVIDVEAESAYTSVGAYDPYPAIEAQMNAAGDAVNGKWTSCFNHLQSNDFEMIQLAHP